jgi:hypothetical protein
MLASLVVASALFIGRSAVAQVYVFDNDESSYDAANYSIVDSITFDGLPLTQGSATSYSTGLNVGGVDFTTPTGTNLLSVGPDYESPLYDFDSTSTLNAKQNLLDGTAVLDAALPTNLEPNGVSTVGADLGSDFAAGTIVATITLTGGATVSYDFSAPDASTSGLEFLGFASVGNTIASISFSDSNTDPDPAGGPGIVVDNFQYGDVIPTSGGLPGGVPLDTVPEPTSLSLLAFGAVALLAFRRRIAALAL